MYKSDRAGGEPEGLAVQTTLAMSLLLKARAVLFTPGVWVNRCPRLHNGEHCFLTALDMAVYAVDTIGIRKYQRGCELYTRAYDQAADAILFAAREVTGEMFDSVPEINDATGTNYVVMCSVMNRAIVIVDRVPKLIVRTIRPPSLMGSLGLVPVSLSIPKAQKVPQHLH